VQNQSKYSLKASILSIVAILLAVSLAMPVHAAMQDDVDQAVTIIERFQEIPEKAIPTAVMRGAKGLAILTVTKGGFIFSGRGGTGIVVARTEKGWSGPSAIGTGGIGFGFQAGVQPAVVARPRESPLPAPVYHNIPVQRSCSRFYRSTERVKVF
jgi:hypothetical protein